MKWQKWVLQFWFSHDTDNPKNWNTFRKHRTNRVLSTQKYYTFGNFGHTWWMTHHVQITIILNQYKRHGHFFPTYQTYFWFISFLNNYCTYFVPTFCFRICWFYILCLQHVLKTDHSLAYDPWFSNNTSIFLHNGQKPMTGKKHQ